MPQPLPYSSQGRRNPFASFADAWREIRDLVHLPRYLMWLLAALGACVGLAETAFLAIVASVGVALAGDRTVTLKAPFGSIDGVSIAHALGVGAVAALATLAAQVLIIVSVARINTRTVAVLRQDTYRDFVETGWAVQRQEVEGVFLSYIVNFIPRVASVLTALINELTAAITLLVFLAAAVTISPLIALVVIAVGTALFGAFLPVRRMARRAGQESTVATRTLYGSFVDAVGLSREIKAYGVGTAVRAGIDQEIVDLERPAYRTRLLHGIVPVVYIRAVFLIMLGGLGLIYTLEIDDLASIGASMLLVLRALQQAQSLQSQEQAIAEARPWIADLKERRQRFKDNVVVVGDVALAGVDTIEFDNVSYRYSDDAAPALDGVSFTARRGELIGLIGPSGGGKSTLSEIVVRLDKPASGSYRVNGRDAWDYSQDSWTQQVVLVSQTSQLLAASVEENIRFLRPDIGADAVRIAAKRAHLAEEIEDLEAGYATEIGERGRRGLSGGQRQRLSIARAVARPPSLVVLDEPTSALDHRAEEAIVETIQELREHACVLVTAHRMSTLRHCDRVLVLRDGKREAFCTLAELQEQSAFFRTRRDSAEL